jgi:GNAT superfamily N-acetyltransferase
MRIAPTRNRTVLRSPEQLELLRTEIDRYLKGRFGYRADLVSLCQFGMALEADRAKVSLFARTEGNGRLWPANTFVLCRLGFAEKRRGHGRSLIEFLLRILPKYGYSRIVLDECNKDASQFAAKLGFVRASHAPRSFYLAIVSGSSLR